MMQEARSVAHDRKKEPSPSGKPGGHSSAGAGPAFQHYQAAVQLLQQGKYDKALAAFEKLLPAAPAELWNAARCTSAPASGNWKSTT
jgi:TolA-binding protein